MEKVNINEHWYFLLNQEVDPRNVSTSDLESWRELDLPHDWSIELDFNPQSKANNEGGILDGGLAYYAKELRLPESYKDKDIRLRFSGVYMDSSLYINGKFIANYPFGYNTFSYDVSDYLNYDETNLIVLKIVHKQPSSRWYSGSGIYRDVDLLINNKVHLKENGLVITSPELEEEQDDLVRTNVKTSLVNKSEQAQSLCLEQAVLDAEGKQVSEVKTLEDIKLEPAAETTVEQDLFVKELKLWSPEDPNLYYLETKLYAGDDLVDSSKQRFGYKYMLFTSDKGFYLNGQFMKIKGVCLHHGNGALGAVANKHAIKRQLEIMQDMGVNAIRTSHNPSSNYLIDLADEMGFLIQEEAFDTWSGKPKKTYDYNRFFDQQATHPDAEAGESWAEFDIKQMVRRDRNNPCIFMWSIGNEILETLEDYGPDIAKNLYTWIKEVDKTSYVSIAEDKFRMKADGVNYTKVADEVDVVGLNYVENNFEEIRENHPDWKIYGSETSSAVRSRGIYYEPAVKDKVITGNKEKPLRQFQTSDYGNDRVGWGRTTANALIFDRDHQDYAGQFIWTGFDYIGEPTPWYNEPDTPTKSSYFGIVDTCGFPKNDFYLVQSQWRDLEDKVVLRILPHWNFNPELRELLKRQGTDLKRDDNKVPVRVYSNAPKVELFLNGESLGLKEFKQKETSYGLKYQEGAEPDELYLEWIVEFTPGELVAKAYDKDGKVLAETSVATADEPYKVELEAEKDCIKADKTDLAYVHFNILDKDNNLVPYADNEVHFELEGPGEIVGVDNGNAATFERYKAQKDGSFKRKAFSGKGLVIVSAHGADKDLKLTAKSEGLESDSITIKTKPSKKPGFMGFSTYIIRSEVGEELTLPETTYALYQDLSKEEVEIEFKDVEKVDVNTLGEYELRAYVPKYDEEFTVKVDIIDPEDKTLEFIETVIISINKGEKLNLPSKVTVHYENGLKEDLPVEFTDYDEKALDKINQFTIDGKVKGIDEEIKAQVKGNGFVSIENFSQAIALDRDIKLQEQAKIYDLLGQSKTVELEKWQFKDTKEEFSLAKLRDLVASKDIDLDEKDYVVELEAKTKDYDLYSTYSLRITEDTVKSFNKAGQWTGSTLPGGMASYTAKDSSLSNINNKHINLDYADSWSNLAKPKREHDYIGIVFAKAGELTPVLIDSLEVYFDETDSLGAPEKVTVKYYAGPKPELPNDLENLEAQEGDLSQEANWKEVVLKDPEQVKDLAAETKNEIRFNPVKTYAVRLDMQTKEDKQAISVNEIQAFSHDPAANAFYDLKVFLDGKEYKDFKTDRYYYEVEMDHVPEITVEAKANPAFNIVPTLSKEDEARIIVKAEAKSGSRTYTFKFI